VFPAATTVVGEGSLCVAENLLVAGGRASKPQSRSWSAEVWGDGSEQQSKGAVRPLAEQREHTSGALAIKGWLSQATVAMIKQNQEREQGIW
jgi:hypothetical protein